MNSTALKISKLQRGFTLIELLIVIGILAVLMGIVLVAINPARQFAQANNTQRQSAVKTILDAVGQYLADHHGQLPTGLNADGKVYELGAGLTAPYPNSAVGEADICSTIVPSYVAAFPEDPSINNGQQITCSANYDSGYQISVSSTNNRITVYAPDAQAIDGTVPNLALTR